MGALHLYLIALGSNLGDRVSFLAQAKHGIAAAVGPIRAEAPVYETEPLGPADQPFLNSALIAASALAPDEVLARLLGIEAELGRVRREKWGNRPIDLDVLLWRNPEGVSRVWQSAALLIPHPAMLERDFVLVPAAEVAGDWVHPGTGRELGWEREARGFWLVARTCRSM